MSKINVQDTEINILNNNGENYISITDMLKSKDGDFLYLIGCVTEIL